MTSVFGLYETALLAEQALDRLTEARFPSREVSVVMRAAIEGRSADGTLGLLAGFAVIAVTGTVPLIAAGPLRCALVEQAEADLKMKVQGTLESSLSGFGLSEPDARSYARRIRDGSVLLSVRCGTSDDGARASGVLQQTPAEAIASVYEFEKVSSSGSGPNGEAPNGPKEV